MFINYAHRGASAYRPENTMESFRLGLQMGANGIETDVHATKDGVLVLFHDDDMKRVTGVEGRIKKFTYEEIKSIPVKQYGMEAPIPTLEEFLQEFSGLDISFAIELKQDFTEKAVIDLLNKYRMQEKTVLTSFELPCLMRAAQYTKDYTLGFLTKDVNPMVLQVMDVIGIKQVCPQAKLVTKELVQNLHSLGYSVRAWGPKDEEAMRHVHACGADGITVNYPDKLTEYLKSL